MGEVFCDHHLIVTVPFGFIEGRINGIQQFRQICAMSWKASDTDGNGDIVQALALTYHIQLADSQPQVLSGLVRGFQAGACQ